MNQNEKDRIAWLIPDMGTGGISFQHLLSEFTQVFPNTIAFTGRWPGYARGFENSFTLQQVGAAKYIELAKTPTGYTVGFSFLSPAIISHLLKLKPRVIFANAFSVWTMLALLFKPVGRWKVVIIHEGSSPGVDYRNARLRMFSRRWMVQQADAFVVNGQAARTYIEDVLGAKGDRVFSKPFLVPSKKALLQSSDIVDVEQQFQARPIFLFVGQIVPRKGLKVLLEACSILKSQGYSDYTLLVVGSGEQRQELEAFAQSSGLDAQVRWVGQVKYESLGSYFQQADVFVFPTYEDIWGMVLVEAMAFGKPVICSKGAGAVEMMSDGENGFIYDPTQPAVLAEHMRQLIDNPNFVTAMGKKSLQIMARHTPRDATQSFIDAVELVQERNTLSQSSPHEPHPSFLTLVEQAMWNRSIQKHDRGEQP